MIQKAELEGSKWGFMNNKFIEEAKKLEEIWTKNGTLDLLKSAAARSNFKVLLDSHRLTNMHEQKTVTITEKEYNELIEARRFLTALENAGVDNWEGYDEARREARRIIHEIERDGRADR